ncbi:hypothetical protein BDV96DRAFT_586156 [Lophiotrema nucula]|uniref:BRCT domain-containing protein n=1 Tax=Lophiotrema nucula TaxID=690887 RepID=A0A6A5YS62_9PLEO|nr:hypothetical protein BDV96DRAFT_586156 [Lophiotrema nucula]
MVATRSQRAATSGNAPAPTPPSTLNAPPKRAARGRKQAAPLEEAPKPATKPAPKPAPKRKASTDTKAAPKRRKQDDATAPAPTLNPVEPLQPPTSKTVPKRQTTKRAAKKQAAPATEAPKREVPQPEVPQPEVSKREAPKRELRSRKRAAEETTPAPTVVKKTRIEPNTPQHASKPTSPLKISPIRPAAAQLQTIEPLQEVQSSPPPSPLKMSPVRPPPAPMSPLKASPRRFVSSLRALAGFAATPFKSAVRSPEKTQVEQPISSQTLDANTPKAPEVNLRPISEVSPVPTPEVSSAPMPEVRSALRSPEKLESKTPKKAVQWNETPQSTPADDNTSFLMPDGPLSGLRVFFDIKSNGQSQNHFFLGMLEPLGAQAVPYWTSDAMGVTHVVFKDGDSSTLAKVQASNGAVKCVTLEWAFQCEKFAEHIAETPFLVDTDRSKPPRVPLTPLTKSTYSMLNAMTAPRPTKSSFLGASARKLPQSAFKLKDATFTPARTPSKFYDENEENVLKTPASVSNLSMVSIATLPSTPGASEFDLDNPIPLAKSAPASPEDEEIRYFFTMSKSVPSTPNKYPKIRKAFF